jgi:hypothetical protein
MATKRRSLYEDAIRRGAAAAGFTDVDAFQVECWMRLEHGTLDGLGPARFREEVAIAVELVLAHPEESARLAETYS